MNLSIFDYKDYRSFLLGYLSSQPKQGRGTRSVWADKMGCQVAFVSHVLNGHNDLSAEQAEALSRQLGLSKDETEFFILLVEHARAGTFQLKQFYKNLMNEKLSARESVKARMKIKANLSLEDQSIYYSKWLFAAVHMILTIPEFQSSAEKIADYFNQPLVEIRKILEFLELKKFIERKNEKYVVLNYAVFISKDSPLFFHQQNFWRHKAIESIYRGNPDNVHFASVFTLAEKDIKKVKEILLKSIEDSTEVIKPSQEERIYSICMDFFELR